VERFVIDRSRERLPGQVTTPGDADHDAARMTFNALSGAGYTNCAPVDETTERVRLAFGTERFARLATIKARYGPTHQFRFNLNIGPALVRAPGD
jgi:hypothetical protein